MIMRWLTDRYLDFNERWLPPQAPGMYDRNIRFKILVGLVVLFALWPLVIVGAIVDIRRLSSGDK